ncbi:MAG: fibronectin type III domain-containing protein [Patescibacteria group bacterium]|nr:fibronectin type III domain-containing protein [Patescibacteria group bacterium]
MPYWSCTVWSVCSNDNQTRTCQDLNGCGTTRRPIEQQACPQGPEIVPDVIPTGGGEPPYVYPTPTPPGTVCTPAWSCSGWSSCVSNLQTRSCQDLNACATNVGRPAEIQSCTVTPPTCTPNWYCTAWSACTAGTQARTCSDRNSCGANTGKPTESQSCSTPPASTPTPTPTSTPTPTPASCTPNWNCAAWSACTNGAQSRSCTDQNVCGINTGKPEETQSCNGGANPPPAVPTPTPTPTPGSGGSDTTSPTAPTGLTATLATPTQVNLAWTAATDNIVVTGYRVYRNGVTLLTVTATTYADANLAALTSYAYIVAAVDAAGNISQLTPAEIIITPPPADLTPPTIAEIAAGTVTASSVVITWHSSESSAGQVEYGLTTSYGLTSPLETTPTTAHSAVLSGLLPGNTYHYRVAARDAAGNLAQSQDFTVRTLAPTVADRTPPPVVSDLTISEVGQTALVLSWTAPVDASGVVSYDIRYHTAPLTAQNFSAATRVQSGAIPAALGARQSQYISIGLVPGRTYYFGMTSTDAADNISALSNIPQATMLPAPTEASPTPSTQPGTVSVPVVAADGTVTGYTVYWLNDAAAPATPAQVQAQGTDAQVTIRWLNPTDPDFARVKILRALGLTPPVAASGTLVYEGRDETFTDLTVKNGVTYTYTVSALDRSGNATAPVLLSVAPKKGVTQVNAPIVFGVVGNGVSAAERRFAWLVRGTPSQRLYLIFPDGTRRAISSPALAKQLQLPVDRAVVLTDKILNSYPLGAPITAAEKNLLELIDTDGDSLSNASELLLGTDPQKADTDGDGYNDDVELAKGYDPLLPPATVLLSAELRAKMAGKFVAVANLPRAMYYVTPLDATRIPVTDETVVWLLVNRAGGVVRHSAIRSIPLANGSAAVKSVPARGNFASRAEGWLLVDASDGRAYYVRGGYRYLLEPQQVYAMVQQLALTLPKDEVAALPYRRLKPE